MHRCLPLCCSLLAASLLALLLGDNAAAQTGVPAAAAAPPVGPYAVPALAPPPPAPRLGFIAALGLKCKGCKARLAASPIGKLLKNATLPLSAMTGGLVPSPDDHAAAAAVGGAAGPPPPAVGAAAKIKMDNAAAAARADAVRYLGTVDCHWYPEAEKALIASLRADRNECVRLEAALALGQGCCCSPMTIEALRIAAAGSHRDGNPGERSLRVRVAAYNALEVCLCRCEQGFPPAYPYPPRPETPDRPLAPPLPGEAIGQAGPTEAVDLPAYYEHVKSRPAAAVLDDARRTLAQLAPQAPSPPPVGEQRTVYGIWAAAAQGGPPAAAEPVRQAGGDGWAAGLGMGSNEQASTRPAAAAMPPQVRAPHEELRRLPTEVEPGRAPIFLSREVENAVLR